ncbi:MAG: LPS-assembly protein LptD [Syntrophorhabdaceae bacterium PtaU1.Bin034]|jgi:LPS export ABC transporter protein LptC/lipopolysaccharide transport protein LptA|nr:MAG: LPS-assembly protein LptD [Syntrophorhabdaceae bacterium PtaU1.Bin034]
MNKRTTTVYIASGFILAIVFLSAYFFIKKPERVTSNRSEEVKKVLVFKDVKYSGEKKGVVDWELRAKLVRKYIDKSMVELEGIDGEYKPKPGTTVLFKGSKGEMDTEKEVGWMNDVEVIYKDEYHIKSSSMNFDFKKSLAFTPAPVDVQGKRFTMVGVGLNADTKEQIITVQKDVSGSVKGEKGNFKFSSDKFVYLLNDNMYIFEGRVAVKGERMDLFCDKVYVRSNEDTIEKIDAVGKVRIMSQGTIAKSERAVYYFKEENVVLKEDPKITKENVEMRGETIVYNLATDKFSVEKPKMRIEQRR